MSDVSQGPGWWQASDGRWYPPEQAPGAAPTGPPPGTPVGAPFGGPAAGGFAGAGTPQLASWGQRVVAYLVDVAIVIAAAIALGIVFAILGAISDVLAVLVLIVGYVGLSAAGLYFHYLNGVTGQSPGKALTGLKTVGEQTGQVIGGGAGVVRGIAHVIDGAVCGLGYFLPLVDDKNQTIADKLMKTVVVTGAPKRSFGPEIFKA